MYALVGIVRSFRHQKLTPSVEHNRDSKEKINLHYPMLWSTLDKITQRIQVLFLSMKWKDRITHPNEQ